jgi:hypothetical protein
MSSHGSDWKSICVFLELRANRSSFSVLQEVVYSKSGGCVQRTSILAVVVVRFALVETNML